MDFHLRFRPSALALGSLLAFSSLVQAQSSTYKEPIVRSLRVTPPGSTLQPSLATVPAPSSAVAAVAASMRARGESDATTQSLVEVDPSPVATARRHVRLEQRVDGLVVHGSNVKAAFDAQGALVHVVERVVPITPATRRAAATDERRALTSTLARLHPGVASAALSLGARIGSTQRFTGGSFFHRDPEVTRVWVPQEDGSLEQGFLVQTWTARDNLLDQTLVGGDGSILAVEHRTAHDSYNVFRVDPANGPQTVVEGPGAGSPTSPTGWLGSGNQTTLHIAGNNVRAYLDAVSNNAPDAGGKAVTSGNFRTAADLTQVPGTAANRAAAVQNLFFLNNTLHDVLYRHGFDEPAGNFQLDNFGKGGAGSDAVNAEAQDGGGMNNANFATPSDGSSPRMQMYLWDGATAQALQRDGDLDSDIVYHEYGHGLTWRMIGGMSGPLAGAIGEGASDTVAFLMNGRDVIGAYAYSRPSGIRRYRYAGYPLTYADVKGSSVHDDGEVYGATLWRLRELWLDSGRSNDTLFGVFVDGMNFTPSTPAYEDMRNGMLDAIAHGGASDAAARCTLIWKAFAQFGVGDGAKGVVSGGKVTITPSTKARTGCAH